MVDTIAGYVTLEGTECKMLATHEIETYPEPTEGLAQGCCGVGKYTYLFMFIGNVGEEVLQKMLIASFFAERRV
jgi:hypothetical protein